MERVKEASFAAERIAAPAKGLFEADDNLEKQIKYLSNIATVFVELKTACEGELWLSQANRIGTAEAVVKTFVDKLLEVNVWSAPAYKARISKIDGLAELTNTPFMVQITPRS